MQQQKLGKFGKNPGVETSFLPDRYDGYTCHSNRFFFVDEGWYLVSSYSALILRMVELELNVCGVLDLQ